eukprot:scaffold75663_cov31-Tisochrysis_lutea.AAC.8
MEDPLRGGGPLSRAAAWHSLRTWSRRGRSTKNFDPFLFCTPMTAPTERERERERDRERETERERGEGGREGETD